MKDILITILRDKKTSTAKFRKAADNLATNLANETMHCLEKQKVPIQTPLIKTAGYRIKNKVILVPILRAGLALLPSFLKTFEDAGVGFIGLKRDEKTYEAKLYYKNIPKISPKDNVLILDPMLATGGSLVEAIKILINAGAREEKIFYVGVVSAPEGLANLKKYFPKVQTVIAVHDQKLNKNKYILPGLGDFGDRYFNTQK